MLLKIKVTKEILKSSMYCRFPDSRNCAIALAIRDVFPVAQVGCPTLQFGIGDMETQLPEEACAFIAAFDRLSNEKEKRVDMQPIEFEIDVPEAVIETIGLSEVYRILKDSKTLELV